MALITAVQALIGGAVTTPVAANASDTFRSTGREVLVVTNGATPTSVAITVPGTTKYGQANPVVTVAVAASTTKTIGPFPEDLNDPVTGVVTVTYTPPTTVTHRLVRV